jgi:N,N'-diacetyllegionaminate synthase
MSDIKIVAELCQNHNGSMRNVEEMVCLASENGASHVKIQNIQADMVTKRPQFELGVEVDGEVLAIKRPYQAEYDRLKKLELSFSDCEKFVKLCEKVNVVPLTTCFSHNSVQNIVDMGFKEVKVASYDCGSFPLIARLCGAFDTVHISTGASYNEEITQAVNILKHSNTEYFLYHCVTIYPTPLHEMHLARLDFLSELSGGNQVGLSEHSLYRQDGVLASMAALALGATCIERHFTNLSPEQSKDGPVSIDAKGLKQLAVFGGKSKTEQVDILNGLMPDWQDVLVGQADRKLSKTELLNRDYFRGRFGSIRDGYGPQQMILNWDHYNG